MYKKLEFNISITDYAKSFKLYWTSYIFKSEDIIFFLNWAILSNNHF